MNEDQVIGTAKNLGGKARKLLAASLVTPKARLKGSSTRPAEPRKISMVRK